MPQVKAFRDGNHEHLAEIVNDWLRDNKATAINISVTHHNGWFHAFVLYETSGNG